MKHIQGLEYTGVSLECTGRDLDRQNSGHHAKLLFSGNKHTHSPHSTGTIHRDKLIEIHIKNDRRREKKKSQQKSIRLSSLSKHKGTDNAMPGT